MAVLGQQSDIETGAPDVAQSVLEAPDHRVETVTLTASSDRLELPQPPALGELGVDAHLMDALVEGGEARRVGSGPHRLEARVTRRAIEGRDAQIERPEKLEPARRNAQRPLDDGGVLVDQQRKAEPSLGSGECALPEPRHEVQI